MLEITDQLLERIENGDALPLEYSQGDNDDH